MSKPKYDRSKRSHWQSVNGHRGVYRRVLKNGEYRWGVYHDGGIKPVEGGQREALALQADLRRYTDKVRPNLKPRTVKEVFSEVMKQKEREGVRRSTRDDYESDFEMLPAGLPKKKIQDVAKRDIETLIDELLDKGLSRARIDNRLKPLRIALTYAEEERYIVASPFRGVRLPRNGHEVEPPHEWSEKEIAAVIAAARVLDADPPLYAPLNRGLFETGCRMAEATGLLWQDFDGDKRIVQVRRQWTKHGELIEMTKTAAGRRAVWITDEYAEYLETTTGGSQFDPGHREGLRLLVRPRAPLRGSTTTTARVQPAGASRIARVVSH